jgi:hypothetical protein
MLRPAMVRVLTLLIVGSLLTSCGVLEPAGDILLTLRLKSAEGRFTWASNRRQPSHDCTPRILSHALLCMLVGRRRTPDRQADGPATLSRNSFDVG